LLCIETVPKSTVTITSGPKTDRRIPTGPKIRAERPIRNARTNTMSSSIIVVLNGITPRVIRLSLRKVGGVRRDRARFFGPFF
jgi:hypothetical protein